MLKEVNKYIAAEFVSTRHYSAVMPRLTKHYLGYFNDEELVGVITFGWGTRPKHTIQKLFPELDTKDYYEIGKMCLDDKLPRNSESQLLSSAISWLKENTKLIFRKETKTYGTKAGIEGPNLDEGTSVTVLEDVVTTAGSAIKAINKLRENNFLVNEVLSVVDRQEGGYEALKEQNIKLKSLFSIKDFL